jgi:hypothetical protein
MTLLVQQQAQHVSGDLYVKQNAVDSSMNVLETQLLPRASLLAHVLSKQATWLNVHVSTTTVIRNP